MFCSSELVRRGNRRESGYVGTADSKNGILILTSGRVYGATRMDTFWAFRQA
jgi:hypothetical protein